MTNNLEHESAAVTVMDARTGFVLYESAQHEHMYPASVTKVMTALLVLEEVENLSEELVFSEYSVESLPYYASRMHVAAGDAITVHEALYGLMLPSGNEVANALAEHVSGSVEAFVAMMNRRAAELGATNTRFINPCGLPGYDQHTTAYDIALIMREAINYPVFNEIIATARFEVSPTYSLPYGFTIRNTNRMILADNEYYNPWVVGGKTGFTNAAQHTLVSYARRGEHELIVSVLHAPRGATFTDTAMLMDYAFAIPFQTIFRANGESWDVPVLQAVNGEATEIGTINAEARGELRLPFPADMPELRYELYIPESLSPPVRIHDVVGHKSFYAGNTLIGEIELVATNFVLPRVIMPRDRPEPVVATPEPALNISPFFALMPLATLMLIVIFFVLLRRYRLRVRYQRRMARIRYARYGGLEDY